MKINLSNFNLSASYLKTAPRVSFGETLPLKNRMLALDQFTRQNTPNSLKSSNPNILNIYYYNDTHGNSDQMAEVVYAAKKFREETPETSSFVLSAGDNCAGGDYKKNEFIFDLMQNIMQVDASAIGNHEADAKGVGFYNAAKDKNITFVATNVVFDDDNPMKDVAKKSIVKEKGGVKYGFIGTMPIDFEMCTKEDSQKGIHVMSFEDTVKALQKEIDNLKAQGINRIILLSHIGYDADKKLVSELDGVDIVIGGHTHNVVEGAKIGENVLGSKSGEPVVITQGGENGQYYGILNVEFDDNGVIKALDNNLTKTVNREKAPAIEYIKTQNLGVSPHVATITDIDPIPPNRRTEPCGWTELMADSIKNEMGVEIAFVNSANLRKVPKVGNLTEADIVESSPMKNKILKTRITQKQLVECVRNAAKNTMTSSDGYPGLMQGSGFTYKIDDTGELLEMNIKNPDGTLTPVDINNPSDNVTYSAAYDNFVAKADGETPELAPKFEVEQFDFDKDKTTTDYILKLSDKENLKVKCDGRLEIIETSKEKQKGNSIRKI